VEVLQMNKKTIWITFLIIAMTLFSFNVECAYSSPTTNTQPTTDQTSISTAYPSDSSSPQVNESLAAENSFWLFLNNVAGINTKDFKVDKLKITHGSFQNSSKSETIISAVISNNKENLSIAMSLVNEKVNFFSLSPLHGDLPGYSLSINDCLLASKSVLSNYQTSFKADYCNELNQLTPLSVKEANVTISNNDCVLSIQQDTTSNVRFAELTWSKKLGDIASGALSVCAIFSKTGVLTYFIDGLGVYSLANTTVTITEEKALEISRSITNSYAQENNFTVSSIDSKLIYATDLDNQRGDVSLIYPYWEIVTHFNSSRFFSYNVLIWADTGEIYRQEPNYPMSETITTSIPSNEVLIIAVLAIMIFISAALILVKKKLKKKKAELSSHLV
jgi:hypothetical protein